MVVSTDNKMTFWYTFWFIYIVIEILIMAAIFIFTKEKILSFIPSSSHPESNFWSTVTELLHVIAAVPMDLGFLLPKQYLPYHIIAILLLLLHWKTNDDNCILTEIQNKLDGTEGHHFTPQFLNDLFNTDLPPTFQIGRFTKYIALTLSFIRLIYQ